MIKKQYTTLNTSLGTVYITAENGRIVRIGTTPPPIATSVRRDTSPLLAKSADALRHYLNGDCSRLSLMTKERFLPFQQQIFNRVENIPYGHTITVKQLASDIGKPHAVRAVETVCRTNPLLIAIPCHRVLLNEDDQNKPSNCLSCEETLRRLEKRCLDKGFKRR